jgi:hypothetical protein
MAMTTNELIQQLTEVDPEGNRDVYITAWFGNNEPLTDLPGTVYIDDEDDVMISGELSMGSGGTPYRRTDATRLTSFHAVMLILATLLVVVLALNVIQP